MRDLYNKRPFEVADANKSESSYTDFNFCVITLSDLLKTKSLTTYIDNFKTKTLVHSSKVHTCFAYDF